MTSATKHAAIVTGARGGVLVPRASFFVRCGTALCSAALAGEAAGGILWVECA